jgi:hypothetical protein
MMPSDKNNESIMHVYDNVDDDDDVKSSSSSSSSSIIISSSNSISSTIICLSLDLALCSDSALRVYAAIQDSNIIICCCIRADNRVHRPYGE